MDTMKPMLEGRVLGFALQRAGSTDAARSPAVNALGFAGSPFVRDEKQLAVIVGAGPMAALAAVAGPRSA